ncbi:FG-GAP-like repeat-containing protein [Streptomyces sp. NPDC057636]|uniref:FG-GAP-like repeat-containing protein n=1 Tax=Streptomyces sp. NPDC057636 TaxID=3346189 RepID=UPI0036A45022
MPIRTRTRTRTPIRTLALAAATATVLAATGLAAATTATAADAQPPTPRTDFNHDGYADLAVGLPNASVSGVAKAGYVNIVWGGKGGLGAGGSTRISQATTGVPGTPESGDRFGASVTTADVDGDGHTDLVVGAPGEDVTGKGADAGTVAVVHGSATGFAGGTTVADGPAASAAYGKSLVADDFTGDGEQDIVIGATDKVLLHTGTTTTAFMGDHMGGRAPVLAAGDFNHDGTADVAVTYYTNSQPYTQSQIRLAAWNKDEQRLLNYWNSSNGTASALAAGDFNGDGFTDLAMGNCRENADENIDDPCGPEKYTKGGSIHIQYGDGTDLFWGRRQTFNQDTPDIPGTAETGDLFGGALTVADLDGDGYDDLIVGAPGEAIGSKAKAGAITALRGGKDGIVNADGKAVGVGIQQDTPGIPGAAEAGDLFGAALAADDYDGDGLPDVTVGSPGENGSLGAAWQLRGADDAAPTAFSPRTLGLPSSVNPPQYGSVFPTAP